jgi:SET domain-containing protein
VKGYFISGDVDEDIEESVRDNAYRYDADRYISPQGKIGDMLNHSCNPNAKVSKEGDKLLVRAIKHIPVGKEVVIDYATITGADDIWSMKCNCGSTKCRGKIVPFKRLPKELRDTYKKLGIVPAHILAI